MTHRTGNRRNLLVGAALLTVMASPAFASLERMLIERLAPHPDALRAVLEGLRP